MHPKNPRLGIVCVTIPTGMWCKIPRSFCYLTNMDFFFLRINVLRHLRTKSTWRQYYASTVGSLMYVMLYIRPNNCFVVGMVSGYQSNIGLEHWTSIKHIFKYQRRTREYMLVFYNGRLVPIEYRDSNFQSNKNSHRFTFDFVSTLSGANIS